MVHNIDNKIPSLSEAAFIAWNAEVAGNVILGKGVSIWFSAVLRGDVAPIHVGGESNIQDGVIIHGDMGIPTTIGNNVTIGHRVILHSCVIEDNCLIGMGSIILGRSRIGRNSIVAAGSLILQNKEFPPGSLIMGSPAKVVRPLRVDEIQAIMENSWVYVELATDARTKYREYPGNRGDNSER